MGVKEVVALIKDLVTIVSLSFGAWFAYWRFIRGQPLATHADISQAVYSKRLDPERTLIQVTVSIKNNGERLVRPFEGFTQLQQVVPVPPDFLRRLTNGEDPVGATETELDWPEIAYREYPLAEDELRIHPGETAQLYCEFIIPADVEVFVAYSLISPDENDRDLGWDVNTYHEVQPLALAK